MTKETTDTGGGVQRLLRLEAVLPVSGAKSPQQLYNWIADGEYPSPIKIGKRAVAWVESEVVAAQQKRIAERDAKLANKSKEKAPASV